MEADAKARTERSPDTSNQQKYTGSPGPAYNEMSMTVTARPKKKNKGGSPDSDRLNQTTNLPLIKVSEIRGGREELGEGGKKFHVRSKSPNPTMINNGENKTEKKKTLKQPVFEHILQRKESDIISTEDILRSIKDSLDFIIGEVKVHSQTDSWIMARDKLEDTKSNLLLLMSYMTKWREKVELLLQMKPRLHVNENDQYVDPVFAKNVFLLLDGYSYVNQENKLFGSLRPPRDQILQDIMQVKIKMKVEKINSNTQKLFEEIESVLKVSWGKIETLQENIQNIREENDQLSKTISENFKVKRNQEIKDLTVKRNPQLNPRFPTGSTLSNAKILESAKDGSPQVAAGVKDPLLMIEEFYQKANSSLGTEVKKLQVDFDKSQQTVRNLKEKNAKLEEELYVLKKQGKNVQDKSVDCNFVMKNITIISEKGINIFKDSAFSNTGICQTHSWTLSAINLLLHDKMISDVIDFEERRVSSGFSKFVISWFAKRFGSKLIAETMLKDFIVSLKTHSAVDMRCRLICKFLEIETIFQNKKKQQGKIIVNKVERRGSLTINISDELKSNFMQTKEASKFLIKIGYYLKRLPSNPSTSYHKPFLPNNLVGHDLMSSDVMKRLLDMLLKDEGMPEKKIKDIYEGLLIQLPSGSRNTSEESKKPEGIPFDYFCDQIFEIVSTERLSELERLYMMLKLQIDSSKSRGGLNFDDFYLACRSVLTAKSSRWIEFTFKHLIKGSGIDKNGTKVFVSNVVPHYFDEKSCLDSYKNLLKTMEGNFPKDLLSLSDVIEDLTQAPYRKTINIEDYEASSTQVPLTSLKAVVAALGKKKTKPEEAPKKDKKEIIYERICQFYDGISSMNFLQESYVILRNMILHNERGDEELVSLHEKLRWDLQKMPQNLFGMMNFDLLNKYTSTELVATCEEPWLRLRKILNICNRKLK